MTIEVSEIVIEEQISGVGKSPLRYFELNGTRLPIISTRPTAILLKKKYILITLAISEMSGRMSSSMELLSLLKAISLVSGVHRKVVK